VTRLSKQLDARIKGSWTNNEDWWNLVYDTEAKRLFVEHSWSHVDPHKISNADSGRAEIASQNFSPRVGKEQTSSIAS
jgi:hypothetical protein